MTLEKQSEILGAVQHQMRDIMLNKGDDYANEDRLSNFKQVAHITGLTPQQVITVFLATKVARISNLLKKEEVKCESITDSCVDLANYSALLLMVESE